MRRHDTCACCIGLRALYGGAALRDIRALGFIAFLCSMSKGCQRAMPATWCLCRRAGRQAGRRRWITSHTGAPPPPGG